MPTIRYLAGSSLAIALHHAVCGQIVQDRLISVVPEAVVVDGGQARVLTRAIEPTPTITPAVEVRTKPASAAAFVKR